MNLGSSTLLSILVCDRSKDFSPICMLVRIMKYDTLGTQISWCCMHCHKILWRDGERLVSEYRDAVGWNNMIDNN